MGYADITFEDDGCVVATITHHDGTWVDARSFPIHISPLMRAREKFGGPFAHEPGTHWTPHATPVLTRWMAKEPWGNQA